jgi:hypothetical protein
MQLRNVLRRLNYNHNAQTRFRKQFVEFFDTHKFTYLAFKHVFLRQNKMRHNLKNRLALSTVVTTLIVLVISVLLAGVVTYYAINVVSTRVQQGSLTLTMLHVWYDPTSSSAQAAFAIINTGGRDVVINKITIRGQPAKWDTVWCAVATPNIDLKYSAELTTGDAYYFTEPGVTEGPLTQATGELTLQSGNTLIVYITTPDSVTINDIGLTVAVTVFTAQAIYYQECNVQANS